MLRVENGHYWMSKYLEDSKMSHTTKSLRLRLVEIHGQVTNETRGSQEYIQGYNLGQVMTSCRVGFLANKSPAFAWGMFEGFHNIPRPGS